MISRYKAKIFLLLGTMSTCSCVAFVGMGGVISVYTILLALACLILIFEKKMSYRILSSELSKRFFLLTLCGILSSVFGSIFFLDNDEWLNASVSGMPKILLYFLFFGLLIKSSSRLIYVHALLRGLMYGVMLNVTWAIVDAIIYYLSGFSITNEIFRSYIVATNTRYGMLSLVIGGIIRSGGLNGDPANIGMFAPILASYSLYSKKYWLLLLSAKIF